MERVKPLFLGEDLLWRPFSLKFESPRLEAAFRGSVLPGWMQNDFVVNCVALVFFPVRFGISAFKLPFAYLFFAVIFTGVYIPGSIVLYFYRRDLYARWRIWSVLFRRLCVYAAMCAVDMHVDASSPSATSVLRVYLVESPARSLLFLALATRVEFRYHIWMQTVQTLFGLIWIVPFCQTCSCDPKLVEVLQKMGYGVDYSISYLVLGREPDPTVYPCWMVSGFAIAVLGWVLPSLLIFLLELWARRAFAQRNIVDSSLESDKLSIYARQAVRVAVFASVALVLGIWFCLSRLRDFLFPEHSAL